MRFQGSIDKQAVFILLDSGSACRFINSELAQQIPQHQQSCEALHFSVADGSPMVSDSWISQMQWSIQGHSFTYDTRVISLKGYDMILGAD
jgi:hypothetical protein